MVSICREGQMSVVTPPFMGTGNMLRQALIAKGLRNNAHLPFLSVLLMVCMRSAIEVLIAGLTFIPTITIAKTLSTQG